MLNIVLSTVAFFVASHYAKRCLDDAEIPKGITRNVLVMTIALAVSFIVAAIVDRVA